VLKVLGCALGVDSVGVGVDSIGVGLDVPIIYEDSELETYDVHFAEF
jgi:hypothetical protein